MDAVIRPSSVAGEAVVPPSKSATHRALIAYALAGGGTIERPLDSRDTRATADALTAFGAGVDWGTGLAEVTGFPGGRPHPPDSPIDCANSGTTLRLACGLAALGDGETRLTGDASLRTRPNGPLLAAIESLGGRAESVSGDGTAPLVVAGPIHGGSTTLSGGVSSQFVSSLLLVGALTAEGIDVRVDGRLVSAPYVDLTRDVLSLFDVETSAEGGRFRVDGGQRFRAPKRPFAVDPDPSAASYPLAAGMLAGSPGVTVDGIANGFEKAPILDILDTLGATVDRERSRVTVSKSHPHPAEIDLYDASDLLPTVAVLASVADGTSYLVNCGHVRHKESDRIATTAAALRALGVEVTERSDGLAVHGRPNGVGGGIVRHEGDHRIAMAGAIAGLVADAPVRLEDADVVNVSYPDFFEALIDLGADIDIDRGETTE